MPHFSEKWGIFLFLIHDLLNSREFDEFKTARAESPTPNRAVRKGCYSIDS